MTTNDHAPIVTEGAVYEAALHRAMSTRLDDDNWLSDMQHLKSHIDTTGTQIIFDEVGSIDVEQMVNEVMDVSIPILREVMESEATTGYTPTTMEIRSSSTVSRTPVIHSQHPGVNLIQAERMALKGFDQWLAEIRAHELEEVAAYIDRTAAQSIADNADTTERAIHNAGSGALLRTLAKEIRAGVL